MTRLATVEDSKAISELCLPIQRLHAEKAPWLIKNPSDDSDFLDWLRAELDKEDSLFLVTEDRGKVVGYLYAQEVRRDESWIRPKLHYLMLNHISVSSDFRRRGFGHDLMNYLIDLSRERGISRVDLEVWDFNEKAQKFFSNYGFESLSIRKTLKIEK